MIYKNSLISFSLILIVSFLTWISFFSYKPKINQDHTAYRQPDALMEQVTALIFDKQGKPKLKVTTPQLVHFNSEDMTEFVSPLVTLYRNSPNPWLIKAKQGKATQGIEYIDFWDNVSIRHAADEVNPDTHIKTSALTVRPNKNLAETKKAITLVQPSLVVTSIGMHANLNTGDIKLLSRARGEYVPHS